MTSAPSSRLRVAGWALLLLPCLSACMRPGEDSSIALQTVAPQAGSALKALPEPLPPKAPIEPGVRAEPEADVSLPDGSAADAAHAFYRLHLQLHASGLPVGEDLARYRPLLSRRLLALMEPAARERDRMIAQEPGLKPPYIEGDMFSGLADGVTGFELGKRSVLGPGRESFEIEFVCVDSDVTVRRNNRASMVREDGRWKLDDVEYGEIDPGDGDFVAQGRLSDSLK
ncbi:hypothetical protein [Lysobacter sp. CA199]|uniref:hypothetical protein n=1 Tax=Lysobacter sp. CA199 TaxID=3455608 RepID=UPI003F8D8A71